MRRVVQFTCTLRKWRRARFVMLATVVVSFCWLADAVGLNSADAEPPATTPAAGESDATPTPAAADVAKSDADSTPNDTDVADKAAEDEAAGNEATGDDTGSDAAKPSNTAANNEAPAKLADKTQRVRPIAAGPIAAKLIPVEPVPVESVPVKPISDEPVTDKPTAGFAETSDEASDPPLPADVLATETDATAEVADKGDTASSGQSQPIGPTVPDAARPQVETATFKNVQPGESTAAQLKEAWGEPAETVKVDGGLKHIYAMPPFREAAAVVKDDVVTSLVISLERPLPAETLAAQLDLADVRGVDVPDEFGVPLGQVFPERGVLFGFAPKSNQGVGHVILEPVDIQPFLWRAEVSYRQHLLAALADVEFVLEKNPETARAQWLRARVLGLSHYQQAALEAATEAVRLSPDSAEYRVTYAQQLEQSGQSDRAAEEIQRAIELADDVPEVKGRAILNWADMVASGAKPDYAQSVELRQQAIKLCQPLSNDRRVFVRDEANEVLFDAYLGLARDIAWGRWNRKPAVVPRWLSEANKLGRRLAKDRGRPHVYEFAVARAALDASVGMGGRLRVEPFVELAISAGDALANASDDPWTRARWQWETGVALFDVTQVYQLANKHAEALRYGEMAVARLEQGSEGRAHEPLLAIVLGQARFRVGSIHAVAHSDHQTAVVWFERAAPLLERPLPQAAEADTGSHGERFVSMAVSYWETGARDEAVRLTKVGADLMEQAIKMGNLDRSALAVPLNNLALMHRGLGDPDQAKAYEQTASRLSETVNR